MDKNYTFRGNETIRAMVKARLTEQGYNPVDEVSQAGVVITYCTSQTELEDVYFDQEGIIQTAKPQSVLIDLSPSTPTFAKELNAVSAVNSLITVEAPLVVLNMVLPHAFDRNNLMCLVAEKQDHKLILPLLTSLAANLKDTGVKGSAQLARAALSLQTSAQIMSAVEADALYRSTQRLSSSSDNSFGRTRALTPQTEQILSAVNEGHFEGPYTIEMLMAELSAALMAADDVDLILPQAEACLHLLELLAVIGGADKAPSGLALVYGEEAACAENGLDWSRAENTYQKDDGRGYYDDEGTDGYSDFGTYSAN